MDTDSPTMELLSGQEQVEAAEKLLEMVDEGKINEAENALYELTADGDRNYLGMVLLFYSYLNDREDGFLEAHCYSREEIGTGLKSMVSRYGLDSITEAFLTEL